MFEKNIVGVEWAKDVPYDEELETKLAEAINNIDAVLWEDIVKFLNRHPSTSTLIVRLNLNDYKITEADAIFYMVNPDKEFIGCDFDWEEDELICLSFYLRNPMKTIDSK